jgi:hypothetical protein
MTALDKAIKKAADREHADDHLTHIEKLQLVDRYRRAHPTEKLPASMLDAYFEIVF